ncbi:MAG: hypothetical protein ISS23_01950 [Nanoarchaeota archaeon]|nr:hypothetical protein [Nanoarchaeota archaeon]
MKDSKKIVSMFTVAFTVIVFSTILSNIQMDNRFRRLNGQETITVKERVMDIFGYEKDKTTGEFYKEGESKTPLYK